MTSRIYRLLRNNKEQGPFTSEELIQKGLKPYDLVWVDGKSAAWRYPGEMQEFKVHVPLPEEQLLDQFYKKAVQAAVAVNDNTVQAVKSKPRYKVSAAWSKIQTITTPVYGGVMVADQQKTSSSKIVEPQTKQALHSLSWEDAWLDWEKEKKAATSTLKPVIAQQVASQQNKTINETILAAPVLETKYSEPLDSIKERYIENILQKKKSKGFSFGKASEFVLPSIALLVIFSIGYWLLHNNNKTASALTSAPVKTTQAPAKNSPEVTTNLNTQATSPSDNSAGTEIMNQSKQQQEDIAISNEPLSSPQVEERKTKEYVHKAKLTSPVSKQIGDSKKINNVTAIDATSHDITSKKEAGNTTSKKEADKPVNKQFDPSVINNIPRDNAYNDNSSGNTGDLNASEGRPVRRRTNGDEIKNQSTVKNQSSNNQPTVSKRPNVKANVKYVKVPEYVAMNNGNGSVRIENVSDVDLDLVVVDVQYYDASSRFRKGETLYLHNLRAGKTIVVKTPRDINSTYATSKVSLVSSDAKRLYIIGDN
jgi:hypothetical protein